MIGMTDPIGAITMMIGDLMGRLGGERPFMIGWGADSVCMTGLAIVFNIFLGTRKNLKRWLMRGFPMSSFSAGTPILTDGVKGKSSPIGEAAATSSMVSKGVDQDTEEKTAARETRGVKQGRELWPIWGSAIRS